VHWVEIGRGDLVPMLATSVDQFRDHNLKTGSTMADWPAAWRTWYRNQPIMIKPPRDGAPAPRPAGLATYSAEEWLEVCLRFHGLDESNATGAWPRDAGPRPGYPGCRVPPEIAAKVEELRRSQSVR